MILLEFVDSALFAILGQRTNTSLLIFILKKELLLCIYNLSVFCHPLATVVCVPVVVNRR